MTGGYLTRDHGVMARACSTIVAVVLVANTLLALLGFSPARILVSAAGAWAFGANLQASIGRTQRMLALAAQAITLLTVIGLLLVAMLIAESGHRGWEVIPSWLWLIIATTLTIPGIAIADGIRAFSEEA